MILRNNQELKQNDFENEKVLQTFFESNLEKILGYKFLETEFTVGNFRIDTLAFDEEEKSFKIIEYKNAKNTSLVDQGYTYLNLLLDRKADFILLYNHKTGKQFQAKDFDWTQSRIIFISPSFTTYQLGAINKNMPFDLYKITRYEQDIVEIDRIEKMSNANINEIFKGNASKTETVVTNVNKEIVVYTENDHLKNKPDNIKMLYEQLKNKVLDLDDVDIDVKKIYITFKGNTNIIDVELFQKYICITINLKKGTLDDPMKIAEDVSQKGHHGNGDYLVRIKNENDIDNLMPLIKQSLKQNKK